MYKVHLPATTKQVMSVEVADNWMTPIIHFLVDMTLPKSREEARTLRRQAAHYVYIHKRFFKKGFSMPLLTCVTLEEGTYIFKEIHEEIYKKHSRPRSLVQKML